MLIRGKVISLERDGVSGIIKDKKGREYFFAANECKDHKLPKLNEFVSFRKDTDYKTFNIALEVIPETHLNIPAFR